MAVDASGAKATVEYEVNLRVKREVEDAFLEWLREHMHEMVEKTGCFVSSRLYRQEPDLEGDKDKDDYVHLVAVYGCVDRPTLQRYFDHHAAAMRGDAPQRFPGQFSATRRILHLV
jgi:hypothetical protein